MNSSRIAPTIQTAVLGRTDSTITLDGMVLTRCSHSPCCSLNEHSHANFSIVFIDEGSVEESRSGRCNEYQAGDVVLTPVGCTHANRFGGQGLRGLFLEITPVGRYRFDRFSTMFRQEGKCPGHDVLEQAETLLRAMTRRRGCKPLALRDYSLQLLETIFRRVGNLSIANTDWLERLRLQLHDGFQRQFRLSDLADEAGVHPVNAIRCFKKRFGCTIGTYLRNLRLACALGLVVETNLSLSQISEQSGFSDQPHFTRLFKSAFGNTPGSIRKVPIGIRMDRLREVLVHHGENGNIE